jgi:hypothetical protein
LSRTIKILMEQDWFLDSSVLLLIYLVLGWLQLFFFSIWTSQSSTLNQFLLSLTLLLSCLPLTRHMFFFWIYSLLLCCRISAVFHFQTVDFQFQKFPCVLKYNNNSFLLNYQFEFWQTNKPYTSDNALY